MKQHERGETTKANIISTTGKLVAKHGFDNVSLRDVSRTSGENLGSIYYHFKTKEALFEQVIQAALSKDTFGLLDAELTALQNETVTPEFISQLVRNMINRHFMQMFHSSRPSWHHKVIFQLVQMEGPLYELFERQVLKPDRQSITALCRAVYPEISDDQILLRSYLIKIPMIFHINQMSTILKRLGTKRYPDEYLQDLEDTIVRQTQFMLNVPVDENPLYSRF